MIAKEHCIYKYLFISLPFLYAFVYAPYGLDHFDTGFILGLSWQWLTGSEPYTEIIYVRPPVSILLHSVPLAISSDYGVLLDRSLFYFQVALYSYIAIRLLIDKLKPESQKHIYFLSCLAFILSVHTFPPMAWHTVDGIFFALIGIYLITKERSLIAISLGGLALVLSALCKQPYYLIPLLGVGYFVFLKQYKQAFLLGLSITLSFLAFFYWLYSFDALNKFFSLTTGQTKLSDLLEVGFLVYLEKLKHLAYVALPPFIFVFCAAIYRKRDIRFSDYFIAMIVWILLFSLSKYIRLDNYSLPIRSFPEVVFMIAIGILFLSSHLRKKENILFCLLLLSVAWTSSISWGYLTVVLFFAPVVFLVFYHVKEQDFKGLWLQRASIIALALVTFYVGYTNPYSLGRSVERSDLNFNLGNLVPRLSGIMVDEQTFQEFQEILDFKSTYGDNFTVLPAGTLVHYATKTSNPIGVDWAMNAEVNYNTETIISNLEKSGTVVILHAKESAKEGKWGSEVEHYVRSNWQLISKQKHYQVYCREKGSCI